MGVFRLLRKHRDFIIAAIVICGTGVIVSTPWLPNGEEESGLPFLYGLRGNVAAPEDVVIVDIDDIASAKGLPASRNIRGVSCNLSPGNKVRSFAGPMPRCLYAHLIDKIAAGQPDAIGVDVSFEKDGAPKEDAILAAAISDAGNVVLLRRIFSVIDPATNLLTERLETINPTIGDAAFAWAPFPLPKSTTLVNQFWSRADAFGGIATLPTMALLAPYREVLDNERGEQPMEEFVRDLLQSPRIMLSDKAKLDEAATALIDRLSLSSKHVANFFGGPGSFEIIDAYELIRSDTPPDFKNKTVFIGQVNLNTYQQADNFRTVFSQSNGIDLAGVEIAATVFANLRDDATLKRPAPWQSSILLIVAGISMLGLTARFKPSISLATLPILLLIYTVVAVYAFSERELWLPSVGLYAMAILTVPVGAYFQIDRFYDTLVTWLPRRFQRMIWSDEDISGEPINVTGLCVKCDIENYTTASEQSESDDLALAMDKFSSVAAGLVNGCGGEIYVNGDDSITVVWEFDRSNTRMWHQIARAIFKLSETPFVIETDQGTISRRNRIGITYGGFTIAGMGNQGNRTLNAQGAVVNLAARIEDLNKKIGTRILADADLAPHLPHVVTQQHGTFKLKGIAAAVSVIELQSLA